MIELVSCLGGNLALTKIAATHGFRYGARLPCANTQRPWFADQDYLHPDRTAYMAALARHRPHMATVIDWLLPEQWPEVLSWAEEAAPFVEMLVLIPKVQGTIWKIPKTIGGTPVILGFSVPTRYGGTTVPVREFDGWPVHLLGGSPHAQMRYYDDFRGYAEVLSADGNMANLQAHRCRCWTEEKGPKGHWRQLSEIGYGNFGKGSNALAFDFSCRNIRLVWEKLCG
jgi:hypothetical protein